MHCTVIIPAAGSGSRFGGELPKQYAPLRGRPIIAHTIERFLTFDQVKAVIVCAASDQMGTARDLVDRSGWETVQVTEGGATRQESVRNGLDVASRFGLRLVAVHDSVRPFFAFATFLRVLEAAEACGAALPAVPLRETIHRVSEDGSILETAERSEWVAAQTPQIFRLDLLREALQRADEEGFTGTDEAAIVARHGHPVKVVPGDSFNMKITHAEDLHIAESNFDRWRIL
ncbi:MAG: 2-C-methyl-D-erythritol 4-phosphate cytidylyltransferase [Acidobacteriota bacterium]